MSELERQLVDITRTVWKCTVGLEVDGLPEPDAAPARPEFRATVELRGAWSGALTLRCPGDLARRAASAFFGRRPDTIGDADAIDAVGELANMTGGNLKGLLPGPCTLSTPRAEVRAEGAATPGALLLGFVCWPQTFTVELTEERP